MFKKIKILGKLILMVTIPTGFLIYFATSGILDSWRLSNEMKGLQTLSVLAVKMSEFVHESQKERGATGVFMGSKGTKFAAELQQTRSDTDKKITALEEVLKYFDSRQSGVEFKNNLDSALDKFNRIRSHRDSVNSFNIPGGEGIGYYTDMNASFLKVIDHIGKLNSNGELSTSVYAYVNLLRAKEKAGVERATMSNTFGVNRFEKGVFNKFVSAIAAQDIHTNLFLSLVAPEQRDFYKNKIQGQFVDETARMRMIAMEKADQGNFGIDPVYWYTMMTGKINLLKEVEDKLSNDLNIRTDRLKTSANHDLIFFTITIFVSIMATLFLTYLIARNITEPLRDMASFAEKIAEGDLTVRSKINRNDEAGKLAMILNNMAENLRGMIVQLQNSIGQISMTSGELAASSRQMGSNSEETSRQVSSVSAAGEQTNRNVQTVASAAEEMTATIKEISKNVQEASSITSQAVHVAESTNQTISKLSDSSAEIGKVIKVITSIAQQTNLLALNATIEAARAGEAGKGFAVVANEVKDLAKETAKATEEISRKIEAIQTDTKSAVSAIGEIGKIIGKINEISMAIAGAVEEQAVTTTEISRNMAEAARGTSEVVQNIQAVSTASKSTADGAVDIMAASQILSKMGEELMAVVSRFKIDSNGYGKTVRKQQQRQEKAELAAVA